MMSETDHPHFNLVDEPWILARDASGRIGEYSLSEIFAQAKDLEALSNETPQQDFAILRVLLAILQRSISDDVDSYIDNDLLPVDVWGDMWRARSLPLDKIQGYLETWHHRFDLLDDEAPFMQVKDLQASNGSIGDARKLLGVSENKGVLSPMRLGAREQILSFQEASRWLITAQAFDTGGAKTGAKGDPSLQKGKGYPGGPGWDGRLGCIYVEGNSLAETLILNLILCEDYYEFEEWFSDDDAPCWEQSPATCFMTECEPRGRVDLSTWQSRRVRLIAHNEYVSGVILTAGNKLNKENRQGIEWFSAWRRNKQEEDKPVYYPVKHSPSKAMWRGLDSLLPTESLNTSDIYLPPGIVRWLNYLASANGGRQIDLNLPIQMHAVGFEYGTQDSVIVESIDDRLEVQTFVISPEGKYADKSVRSAVLATGETVKLLGTFAANLIRAEGFKDSGGRGKETSVSRARRTASSEAYFLLDGKFRKWLLDIGEDSDLVEKENQWGETLKKDLESLAEQLLATASPAAIVGHGDANGAAYAHHTFVTELNSNKNLKGLLAGADTVERGE